MAEARKVTVTKNHFWHTLSPRKEILEISLNMWKLGSGLGFFRKLLQSFCQSLTVNSFFQVRTLKMHLYTGLQFLGLVVLWVVKSSSMALAFPFFVVGMVPYRLTFKIFFNKRELEAVSTINFTKFI